MGEQFGEVSQMGQFMAEGVVDGVAGGCRLEAGPEVQLGALREAFRVGQPVLVEEQERLPLAEHRVGGGERVTHRSDDDRSGPGGRILGDRVRDRIADSQCRVDGDTRLVQAEHFDAESAEYLCRDRPSDARVGVCGGIGRHRGLERRGGLVDRLGPGCGHVQRPRRARRGRRVVLRVDCRHRIGLRHYRFGAVRDVFVRGGGIGPGGGERDL